MAGFSSTAACSASKPTGSVLPKSRIRSVRWRVPGVVKDPFAHVGVLNAKAVLIDSQPRRNAVGSGYCGIGNLPAVADGSRDDLGLVVKVFEQLANVGDQAPRVVAELLLPAQERADIRCPGPCGMPGLGD